MITIKDIITVSKGEKSEMLNHKGFCHPYNNKVLYSKLQIGNKFNVNDVLEDLNLEKPLSILRRLEMTFRPPGMNPNKDYEPLEYFVENSLEDYLFNALIKQKKEGHRKCIIHYGNKGSGKTITQNVLLYRKNKELEKEKIFWVRCDVHKLYKLLRKNLNIDKLASNTSIKEYLSIQLVYVFCKYYDQSTLLKSVYEGIKSSGEKFDLQMDNAGENFRSIPIIEIVEKFREDISRGEKRPKKEFSYAVDIIMADSLNSDKQRAKKQWLGLSYAIQNYLYNNELYILWIVDGIDNIDLVKTSSMPYYTLVRNQFADFIWKEPDNEYQFHLASLRPRTISEIKEYLIESNDTNDYNRPFDVKFISQDPYDYELLSTILQERHKYTKGKNTIELDNDSKMLLQIIDYVISNDKTIVTLDKLFHENCRNYLHNRMGLIKLIYFRWLQLSRTSRFNISAQYENLKHRSKFLNSRLFMHSKQGYYVNYGDYAFNIFYYVPDKSKVEMSIHNWDGLCAVRVIQLLKSELFEFNTKQKIIDFLEINFGYSKGHIEWVLELLRDFGYIDSALTPNFITLEYQDSLTFKMSHKGIGMYNLTFSNIDVIYLMALDTLLPDYLIEGEKNIESFSNQLNVNTNFEWACLKSSISFIKFILTKEELEKENLNNRSNSIDQGTYDIYFFLPIKENILNYHKNLNGYYERLTNEQKKNIKRHITLDKK